VPGKDHVERLTEVTPVCHDATKRLRRDCSMTTGPRVLLYSDDRTVREQVRLAVGPRLGADAPEIVWTEVATAAAVVASAEKRPFDLLVLDGEADKAGGMGLCRQLKNEIYDCPPVLVLTARPDDAWLASWPLADGVVSRPLDALVVQQAVAETLAPVA
jgi:DNA-binding response OmpR family regulator